MPDVVKYLLDVAPNFRKISHHTSYRKKHGTSTLSQDKTSSYDYYAVLAKVRFD